MLNITAIGLYMILSSAIGGSPVVAQVSEIPKAEPQLIEKTKEEIEQPLTTEAYVRNYFSDLPIMIEISRCESAFRQNDEKGNILRGIKNNLDVGAFQINEHYHSKTAKKMGVNLHTVEGNAQYARYLYEKEGARPWLSSSKCWSRSNELAKENPSKIYE